MLHVIGLAFAIKSFSWSWIRDILIIEWVQKDNQLDGDTTAARTVREKEEKNMNKAAHTMKSI